MSIRSNARAVRVFAFLIVATTTLTLLPIAPAETPSPAAIFAQLRLQFIEMKSIDITSQKIWVRGEVQPEITWTRAEFDKFTGPDGEYLMRDTTAYRAKEDLFRATVYASDSTEIAYNGTNVQTFLNNSKVLFLQDPTDLTRPFDIYNGTALAFLRPFDFVFYATGEPESPETLRSERVWDRLASVSKIVGETEIDGNGCVVVEIVVLHHPRNGIDRTKVFFAREKGYFPVRYEHYIGDDIFEVFQTSGVRASGRCGTSDSAPDYFFAERALKQEFDRIGSGRPTGGTLWETDVDSTRVNLEISDAFFTIPLSEALHVVDWRKGD